MSLGASCTRAVRRAETFAIAACFVLSLLACKRRAWVVSVATSVPDQIQAGQSVPLEALVRDRSGSPIAVTGFRWNLDPPGLARVEGDKLVAEKPGKVSLTVTYEDLRASKSITIVQSRAPIEGRWTRTSAPFKGMGIVVTREGAGWVAKVDVPPPANDEAFAFEKKVNNNPPSAAKCAEKALAVGVVKLKDIKQVADNRWSTSNLHMRYFDRYRCASEQSWVACDISVRPDDSLDMCSGKGGTWQRVK